MSDVPQRPVLPRKHAEIAFALLLALVGGAVIAGAREMDTGWGGSGPEAGYFPLRIGIVLVVASLAVLAREALRPAGGGVLIGAVGGGRLALFVLPLVALVAAAPWTGFYIAAFAYLLVAVGLVGRVPWSRTLAIALGVPFVLFVAFEYAFRAPLPKGPLGPLLGLP
jgi:putative tricarboxylic transport membrane protein